MSQQFAIGQIRAADLQRITRVYKEWGVLAGANMQQMTGYPFDNKMGAGFTAGAYFKKTRKALGLQAAITISSAKYSSDVKVYGPVADFNTLYLNVPIMVMMEPNKKLSLQAGLSYQYLLSTSVS
ncbi:MAG: hypothetical protein EBZ77_15030, partial [Chitinophagia bacterium]|nr:hypothetical protein [Chitinophagia bacterium]